MSKTVLMIGWHPSVVDYSNKPGLTPEKLEGALNADRDRLTELGYETQLHYIYSAEAGPGDLEGLLRDTAFDVVLIGAGVRLPMEHFELFEALVNVAHRHAPQAHIVFNTGPTDSVQAVQRWA